MASPMKRRRNKRVEAVMKMMSLRCRWSYRECRFVEVVTEVRISCLCIMMCLRRDHFYDEVDTTRYLALVKIAFKTWRSSWRHPSRRSHEKCRAEARKRGRMSVCAMRQWRSRIAFGCASAFASGMKTWPDQDGRDRSSAGSGWQRRSGRR